MSLEARVRQLEAELQMLRRELAGYNQRPAVIEFPYSGFSEIHRGVTAGTNDKGSHGNVTRYTDGTNDTSGDTDDVYNDYINVGSGKNVMYVKLADKFYLIAVECPPA